MRVPNNKSAKIIILATVCAILASASAAPDPRHPLSQIYPIDVDLEMENQDIENLSQLQFNNGVGQQGLLLEGYTISDEGEAQKIVLDYQNDEWDILNSNINMNGNNITNIDTLHFVSGASINGSLNTSGGNVNLENGSLTDVYSIDGGGDAVNFFDSIDMNGNIITDSNGALEIDGDIYVPTGSLDMAGNNIVNPGNVDGVDLDDPGNGLDVTDSRYQIIQDAIGNSELNNSQQFTTQGIDVSGGNVTSIDTLKFVEGTSIDGDIDVNGSINTTGGLNLNGNNLTGVDTVLGDEDLNLAGQDASQGVILRQGDGTRILDAGTGTQNVEIPNGNLILGNAGNQVLDIPVTGGNSAGIVSGSYTGSAGVNLGDYEWGLLTRTPSESYSSSVGIAVGEGSYRMYNNQGSKTFEVGNNGVIEVPRGNIDLQGNSLVDTTASDSVSVGDGSDDSVSVNAGDVGTFTVNTGDNSGGSTQRLQITADSGSGDVDIQNANLDLNNNNIKNFFESECSSGEVVAGVDSDGSYYCVSAANEVSNVYVNRSGDSMTGDLDMQGNDIVDVGRQGIGTANPQENLDVDGTASVENSGTRMEVDSSGNVVVTLGS
jgi:hypothetical protein